MNPILQTASEATQSGESVFKLSLSAGQLVVQLSLFTSDIVLDLQKIGELLGLSEDLIIDGLDLFNQISRFVGNLGL